MSPLHNGEYNQCRSSGVLCVLVYLILNGFHEGDSDVIQI